MELDVSYQILSVATQEIFDLPFIKTYLRISHNYDDIWIDELINSAICSAENFLRKTILPTKIKMRFDKIYNSEIILHSSPITQIIEILGYKPSEESISKDSFLLQNEQIIFKNLPKFEYLTVEYIAGYINPNNVPKTIKQGMMLHIAEMYDSRGITSAISIEVQKLYQPYRKILL